MLHCPHPAWNVISHIIWVYRLLGLWIEMKTSVYFLALLRSCYYCDWFRKHHKTSRKIYVNQLNVGFWMKNYFHNKRKLWTVSCVLCNTLEHSKDLWNRFRPQSAALFWRTSGSAHVTGLQTFDCSNVQGSAQLGRRSHFIITRVSQVQLWVYSVSYV